MTTEYNILVIDDTVAILMMLKLILERKGYKVTVREKTDGLEQLVDDLSPDLIIMDVLLSGVDGRDVCTAFRKFKRFDHIPVIMISALDDAEVGCMVAGAQFFLSKPFEMDKFYQTVTAALAFNLDYKKVGL